VAGRQQARWCATCCIAPAAEGPKLFWAAARASSGKGDPAYWHCAMHEAFLNGMTQRWADTAWTAKLLMSSPCSLSGY
jgi:hypothetical protein